MNQNDRIKLIREYFKLTQKEFGKKIDVGQTYLSQLEKGDRPLTEKIIKLICFEFHVSYAWLVNGEGEMFSNSDTALKDKVDQIMEGSSELHKKILKSVLELEDEDLIYFEKWLSNFTDK